MIDVIVVDIKPHFFNPFNNLFFMLFNNHFFNFNVEFQLSSM